VERIGERGERVRRGWRDRERIERKAGERRTKELACRQTDKLEYYTTKELCRESIARCTDRLGDGVDKVVVLQCAVKYDIVGDGRAVELFRINEDTGVITLTQPFTIDDAILYKV